MAEKSRVGRSATTFFLFFFFLLFLSEKCCCLTHFGNFWVSVTFLLTTITLAVIGGFSICFFAACSAEIALFMKFLCQIEKKVVGSAQKLRVGRGALNTAIFIGLIKLIQRTNYNGYQPL